MNFLSGFGIVLLSLGGAIFLMGGHVSILWQPAECLIILGTSVGVFLMGQPRSVLQKIPGTFKEVMRATPYNTFAYQRLLLLIHTLCRVLRFKGALFLEKHLESMEESSIFQEFSDVMRDAFVQNFIQDYGRFIVMGVEKIPALEVLMEKEVDQHHESLCDLPKALDKLADTLPALGIVAAVLGVIHAMGAITEPPEVLGRLIGAALVGTFLGVFFAYAIISPIAVLLYNRYEAKWSYLQCLKEGMTACLYTMPPSVGVEFSRKNIDITLRPKFTDMEHAIEQLALRDDGE